MHTLVEKVSNSAAGTMGELEVCDLVPCPNCSKRLMQLPKNYPLYDVQCSSCLFRAQVKTQNCKPTSTVFGAGWEILDKVLKVGLMMPPLIVNAKWIERGQNHQRIIFYPFIPRTHIKKRQLSPTARRANYWMYNYVKLDELPKMVMYER
jgi:hypothetical protein